MSSAVEPSQIPTSLAYVTQTTLSVDDTAEIVAALKRRFPRIAGPHKEDICYATTNRQEAVKRVVPLVDALIVVGSPNSSNSQRLREVAERAGCPIARLVLNALRHRLGGIRDGEAPRHHGGRLRARNPGRRDPSRLQRTAQDHGRDGLDGR